MSSQLNEAFGIAWNLDGTKMFVADAGSGDDINEYTLSTGFDVSTASFVDSLDVSGQDSRPCGIRFNNDGTKIFMTGFNSNYIEIKIYLPTVCRGKILPRGMQQIAME